MELNGFTIESIGMLKENFLPFWGVWKNVEIGLYQECMRMYFGEDELTPEILSVSAWVWDERTERPFKRVHQVKYQDFAENNREQMGSLEKAAKNEKQKGILYLCVLMHIHARHSSLVPETETFISRLLAEREETGLLEERDVKEGDCSPKRLNIYSSLELLAKRHIIWMGMEGLCHCVVAACFPWQVIWKGCAVLHIQIRLV